MTSRLTIVALLMIGILASLDAKKPPPLPKIRVFITSAEMQKDAKNGFVPKPSKEMLNFAKEVDHNWIEMKGGILTVVVDRAAADLVVEFEGVEKHIVAGSHLLSWSTTDNEFTVKATILVGDKRKDITATSTALLYALNKLARQLEIFATDNRDVIMSAGQARP